MSLFLEAILINHQISLFSKREKEKLIVPYLVNIRMLNFLKYYICCDINGSD